MRVEITVRAFSYTPRNVDVQAQRWCLYEGVQFGRSGQGLLTLIGSALLGLFFRPARQNERGVARLHERMITQLGGKIAPALRVEPEKAPLCVARRSFGVTKCLSSCLDWRFFRLNRADPISVYRP